MEKLSDMSSSNKWSRLSDEDGGHYYLKIVNK